jgi:hypothetical protein
MVLGKKMVKGAKGTKVKVLFQGTHDMCHFFCWFITLNFIFWVPHLTLHLRYKYILIII